MPASSTCQNVHPLHDGASWHAAPIWWIDPVLPPSSTDASARTRACHRPFTSVSVAPGAISLHNCMLPHGPDRDAFEHASNGELKPEKLDETMSFMFETRFPQHLTEFAAKEAPMQEEYIEVWDRLEKKFDGTPGVK